MQKRRNYIEALHVNGNLIGEPRDMKKEAIIFFKQFFKEEFHNRPKFTDLNFKTLDQDQQFVLTDKFSHEETDVIVNACDASKAPRLDGFNFKFIKLSWDVIKSDVYGLRGSQILDGALIAPDAFF